MKSGEMDVTKKLKEIVDYIDESANTPTLSDFKQIRDGITGYKLHNGFAESESLLSTYRAGIALISIPNKGQFPRHSHAYPVQYELLIVLEGELIITINKQKQTLKENDYVKIDRNVKHYAVAVGDVTLIAITIPRDEGFP